MQMTKGAVEMVNRCSPKGVHFERWVHTKGCRRWFNVARHTVTHEILKVYKMGESAPALPTAALPTEITPR